MAKKDIPFEQALSELQSVVERLETGKVALEESLSLYERGMQLIKICNEKLDKAEQRVSVLHMDANGITQQPVTGEELV